MLAFALRLVRPYWGWLLIVIAAMLVETAMSLAAPWPLKLVLDSVFADQPVAAPFDWIAGDRPDRFVVLNGAVAATVVIALLQAASAYLNAYYTVSIGQWVAHDLRQSMYAQQVGPLISTITDDINAVQPNREHRDERLGAKSRESVEAALHARRVRSLLGPIVTSIVAIGTAGVLWFGARQVLEGAMTAGALVVFMTYLGKLFRPIQELARASTNIAQAAVGLERVRAVLDADDRLPRAASPRRLDAVRGRVEFREVTFGYDPARLVLRDLSFVAEPGQLIGLVGPSGSGKSTLVSLIPRFYDPLSGVVSIDGLDVRELSIRSLRRQIGFVLQETQLFHAPVWQNIAYGKPDATRDEIIDAARLAQAHDFIEALPEGYDTMVGQGGLTLSGGQRQRLGIARAMVRDARILVMDEPSSGLDTASERLVFEGLGRLLDGRTTFVIAHRLSTIRNADCILVLDAGRIVQRGTHAELSAVDGLYADMLRVQRPEDVQPLAL